MSAAKILWGQILAVLIIIVASVWSATQWTASALGFQPELGAPWFKAEIHLGVESLVLLSDLIAHKILVLL